MHFSGACIANMSEFEFSVHTGSSSNGLWDLDSGRALALDGFVRGRPGGEAGIVKFDYDPTRTIYREKFVTIQLYAVKTQLDYAILEMEREPGVRRCPEGTPPGGTFNWVMAKISSSTVRD
jgi:hypothetical protein